MHREEEIAKGSGDEKRVGDAGCIPVQAEGVEECVKQTSNAEEREMFFQFFRIGGIRLSDRKGLWLRRVRAV